MQFCLRAVSPLRSVAPSTSGVWLLLGGLAAACAPAPSAGPTPVPEITATTRREIVRIEGGGVLEYHPSANAAWVVEVRGRPDSLWPRLIAAYDQLGVPVGETDTQAHLLGTSNVRATGRLGRTSLSEYLECGSGPMGMPAADAYLVTLRATTELKPGSQGSEPFTTVRTLLAATAKPNTTEGDPVVCTSTGRLETRIARLIAPDVPKATNR